MARSEEHTSELQSRRDLVCRLLLEKKKKRTGCRRDPRRSTTNRTAAGTAAQGIARRGRPAPCGSAAGRWCRRPRWRSFFFNDTATTEIYTLSLHDALPI